MEHSVQKYLERQSTQKLEKALQGLEKEIASKEDQAHICMIKDILRKRTSTARVGTKEK